MTNAVTIQHNEWRVRLRIYRPWWFLGLLVRFTYEFDAPTGTSIRGSGVTLFHEWALEEIEAALRTLGNVR